MHNAIYPRMELGFALMLFVFYTFPSHSSLELTSVFRPDRQIRVAEHKPETELRSTLMMTHFTTK